MIQEQACGKRNGEKTKLVCSTKDNRGRVRKCRHRSIKEGGEFLLFLFLKTSVNKYHCVHRIHLREEKADSASKTFWIRRHSFVSAAAAKSLQSCPTLCDPIDGSPPGSPVPEILQARTLEWVAISFSNAFVSRVLQSSSPPGLVNSSLSGGVWKLQHGWLDW